jgi:hypothetical protein
MLSMFRNKDNSTSRMERNRKVGIGVGNTGDVCGNLKTEQRQYVRDRAVHVRNEAQHRLWLLLLPPLLLRRRLF